MVVPREYMLKKPSRPPAPKVFFDTKIVPRVVNFAGGCEVALDRASTRTGLRPIVLLSAAATVIVCALLGIRRNRGSQRSAPRRVY